MNDESVKRSLDDQLLNDTVKDIAEKEDERSEVYEKYGKQLHPSDVDKIISANSIKPSQSWPSFKLNDTLDIKGTSAKIVGISSKDIILQFSEKPPIIQGELVVVNTHEFKVRIIKYTMASIRPVLGTPKQYLIH
jgi:hypothetical protein